MHETCIQDSAFCGSFRDFCVAARFNSSHFYASHRAHGNLRSEPSKVVVDGLYVYVMKTGKLEVSVSGSDTSTTVLN